MIKIENNQPNLQMQEVPSDNRLKESVLFLEGVIEQMEVLETDVEIQFVETEERRRADI